MNKDICFFDFDGTITRRDTLFEFSKFALGKKRVFIALLKSLLAIIKWKIGFSTNSQAKEILFTHLFKNYPYLEFKQKGKEFASHIDTILRPDTVDILRRHLAEGRCAVIVSASMAEWIEPWAEKNGFEQVIATKPQIDPDTKKITGRFATPNCVGDEKVARIKELYPDLTSLETWAYGDSKSDLPMLALSNHPHLI